MGRRSAVPVKRPNRRLLAGFAVLGALAAAVAAGAAATGAGGGRIYACVKKASGAVRIVGTASRCRDHERRLSWSDGATRGARGAPGIPGAPGARGPTGFRGATGAAGPAGPRGAPGANGKDGILGAAGPTGARGATGPEGAPGIKGATGVKGTTGARGPTGAQGVTAVVVGGAAADIRRTNVTFFSLFSPPTLQASSSESLVQQELTVAGTLSNLRIRLSASNSGGGTSYTFTVRRNGSNTGVTCQIGNGQSSCADSTHSVSFAAGDLISIVASPSGSPTDSLDVRWTARYA
jgi:collagen triple helix repeat protein